MYIIKPYNKYYAWSCWGAILYQINIKWYLYLDESYKYTIIKSLEDFSNKCAESGFMENILTPWLVAQYTLLWNAYIRPLVIITGKTQYKTNMVSL